MEVHDMEIKKIEYMCSWCGKRVMRTTRVGRPEPGQCPRKGKTADGRPKPHTWVINRKLT